jgi:hypothetical protein
MGTGVAGVNESTESGTRGIIGQVQSVFDAAGVYGFSGATTGNSAGVSGFSQSPDGVGVKGNGGNGVLGESTNPDGAGVRGNNGSLGGVAWGVVGRSVSASGVGVFGEASGTANRTIGVHGLSASPLGAGVYGQNSAVSGNNFGVHGSSDSNSGNGVLGETTASSGSGYGVWGRSFSTTGRGVFGQASASSGVNYGVYGRTGSPAGFAGYFDGNVEVAGTLTKSGGSFKIDHPLDPENKFLSHSFVESPDMLNIYNGNVTTDAEGYATVTLPDWFDALNQEFRYQLTVIGSFARATVWQKIDDNQFVVRTDEPQVEVSWQVTGVRHDRWAQAHRIPVETEKSAAERGKYLHPELWNAGREKRLHDGAK